MYGPQALGDVIGLVGVRTLYLREHKAVSKKHCSSAVRGEQCVAKMRTRGRSSRFNKALGPGTPLMMHGGGTVVGVGAGIHD
jgi:hypothetical protein